MIKNCFKSNIYLLFNMIIIDLGNTLSNGELHEGRDEGGGDGGSV